MCARGQKLRANLFWGGVKPVNLGSTVLVIMDYPEQEGKKKKVPQGGVCVVFGNRLLAYCTTVLVLKFTSNFDDA